ncbi:hypothetical protein ACP2AV_02920 [Aliiroseovarius sp. PTFE2010]|uniref:hypothetical protein n=1 Tax=Aliiroseovarius sp. PTFE2010 TaxID=3417190 RepID=UPI003CF023FB
MSPKNILMALAGLAVAFWFVLGMKEDASRPESYGAKGAMTVADNLPGPHVNLAGETELPSDPNLLGYDGEFGFSAGEHALMAANRTVHFIKDAVTPETYPYLKEKYPVPADYHILPNPDHCAPRAIGAGEYLANVFVYTPPGHRTSGLHVISMDRLTDYALKWMRTARSRRDPAYANVRSRLRTERSSHGGVAWAPLETVSVYVGRTEKPAYVLLQAGSPRTLFNIMAAPDAEIAHVQVLSNGPAAVALPDGVDSMEIINVKKSNCHWQPVQEPEQTWGALTGREQMSEKSVRQHYKRYFAYSGWFRDFYGQDPKKNVIGGATGYHMLVGHMPQGEEPRFAHRPLSQSVVYVSDDEVILAGHDDEVARAVQAMQVDLVAQFLDGDINRLIPPNVPEAAPAPLLPQETLSAQVDHTPSQLMETAQ